MMKSPLLLAVLAGCPGDDAPPTNPETLYIAPDGAETRLKLVAQRPAPF